MSRLQRRCVYLSAAGHGLLIFALFAGLGVQSPRFTRTDRYQFNLVSSSAIEALFAQPKPSPEPASLVAPAAEPEPAPPDRIQERKPEIPRVPRPTPLPKVTLDPVKPSATSSEKPDSPRPKPVRPKIKINLKDLTRHPRSPSRSQASEIRDKIRKTLEAARRRQQAVDRSLNALRRQTTGLVRAGSPGPSPGAVARYPFWVRRAYDRAWLKPAEVNDLGATVGVRVIVSPKGEVISARVTRRSGIGALDRSVEAVLARVKRIGRRPPAGSTVSQRTFVLHFNLKEDGP